MEDFDATRVETFDELVTKHTRRELEELAQKLGVENLGTKSQLAEAILEASKKQKEKELPKTIPASPKEAPMIEKPKSAAKSVVRGTKGVMAKSAAIDSKVAVLQKAGREIREDGIRRMNKGVKEFHSACDGVAREMQSDGRKMMEDGRQRFELGQSEFKRSLDAQIKENHDAVARMHSGAREMQASQEKMSRSFQKAGKDIRDSGYRNLQKGLNEFQGIVNSQVKENQKAVVKLNSGARELQGRAASFNSEIHRYQEQDLKNYVRDFYYG
jgi:hypothetical protein